MTGYIYVMGSDEWPYVKIGYSSNPTKRLWYVQVGSPVRLELLAIYKGGLTLEAALHSYFGRHRMNGEWFDLGDNAVERVQAAVSLGKGALLKQIGDREHRTYRALEPAVHPMTGRQFSVEHLEWFQPWPGIDTRFPPVSSAEKGTPLSAATTGQEEHGFLEVVPASHPMTGRQFAVEHLEWFQPWPGIDMRFPPARAAGCSVR